MADLDLKPIWDDAVELPEFAPLASDISVDVAVVGAGLTGITTAFLLQQAGLTVALLERRQAGGVDTGCTTAHLTAVIDTDLPTLASTFGRDHAQAVWDAGLAAIDQIDAVVRRHEIACEFQWVPGFRHVPFDADDRTRARDLDKLREEATLARDLGFDVAMIAATPLGGLPGWRIENQAVFHPRRYLHALLAHLMTSDRVTCAKGDVQVDGTRLSCGAHTVRASNLVIATHTPIAGRLGAAAAGILHSKLAHYTSYAMAARVAPPVATPGACYWDTASPYHYIRADEDHEGLRLIVGGEDHKTGQEPDTTKPFGALEEWFGRLVPTASTTHRWSGRVIETPDGLPLIGEIAERQYIATGFAGNGMTFGTLAAMIISDAITGAKNPWHELFDVNRSAIARGPLDYLRENADYPYYLVRDRFAGAESRGLRSVARGEGQLVEIDGQVVAASRDAHGQLTVVSPTCTHLGCRVAWNTAEKTWDCPCHGSRFADTGEVLAGPAERPLEPVNPRATAAKASR